MVLEKGTGKDVIPMVYSPEVLDAQAKRDAEEAAKPNDSTPGTIDPQSPRPQAALFAPLPFIACSDDDYVYPNVLTEMIDLVTDNTGTATYLKSDEG